jgi:hypothetical protein
MRKGTFAGCCASTLATHTVSAMMIARRPVHFGYFAIVQYRFWIADGSTLLTTGFGLSKRDFEESTFISVFSWLSIQNLKSKIQNCFT